MIQTRPLQSPSLDVSDWFRIPLSPTFNFLYIYIYDIHNEETDYIFGNIFRFMYKFKYKFYKLYIYT